MSDQPLSADRATGEARQPQVMERPAPWYIVPMTADEFLIGMLSLGRPLEVSLVGAFDPVQQAQGRGSRRDIDLPLHRDGVYSAGLADVQGGTYVERPGIDVVGLYCLRDGSEPCVTTLSLDGQHVAEAVNLRAGEALIFDNAALWHGRRGPVGERVLIRMWVGNTAREGEP